MALTDIRDQIRALIGGVTNVALTNVHTYDRITDTKDNFLNRYEDKTLPGIHGWTISRESALEEPAGMNLTYTTHAMILKGWYRVNDVKASEKNFEALIELVLAALRTEIKSDNVLGGYAYHVGPPQVRTMRIETIFDTGCHYVEIVVPVQTRNTL